jgi:hypothetical protein
MNLTDKQKKYAWIAGGVLVFIHFFLPGIVNTVRHAFTPNAPAVIQTSSPVHTAPVPPPPPPPEVVAATKYGGVWEGDTLMPDANRCTVRLEIRLSDDMPKKLKGYSTVRCMPLQPLGRGNLTQAGVKRSVAEAASPASAVMTGTPQDSGITFAVDQSISSSADNCSITGFRIIDFGQGAVAADWQEGTTCPARHMLLRKGRG